MGTIMVHSAEAFRVGVLCSCHCCCCETKFDNDLPKISEPSCACVHTGTTGTGFVACRIKMQIRINELSHQVTIWHLVVTIDNTAQSVHNQDKIHDQN